MLLSSPQKELLILIMLNMKEQILNLLDNKIVYPEEAVNKFMSSLNVRYATNSELYQLFNRTLQDKKGPLFLLKKSSPEADEELKRLNCLGITTRLKEWRQNGHSETVVTRYLQKIVEELQNPTFFGPSAGLKIEEHNMLNNLLEETRFNQDRTEIEGISNQNLRLVLQQWLLYPELIYFPDNCQELLDALSISDCKF